jgi:type II secretory pathway pseudopilin PulG
VSRRRGHQDEQQGSNQESRRQKTMSSPSRSRAFSLTELLIVSFVILVMATLSVALYQRASQRSKVTACLANLRTVSQAAQLYLNQYLSLPDDLTPMHNVLSRFGLAAESMRCPSDKRPNATDSYSACYVRRRRSDPDDSLVTCCGRHDSRERTALLFLGNAASVATSVPVTYRNASGATRALACGDPFPTGTLFCSGGTVTVSGLFHDASLPAPETKPNSPLLIASFRLDAIHQVVIFIPPTVVAQVAVVAGEKERIEVVSAQAVLQVANGSATLTTSVSAGSLNTGILVVGGDVKVRRRDADRAIDLIPGSSYKFSRELP